MEQKKQVNSQPDEAIDRVKVLCLDDDQMSLMMFDTLFKSSYTIYTTPIPDEARQLIKEHEIEVVIVDQRMPTEMGTDFLSSISEFPSPPVGILLTGYSENDDIRDALRDGYVYKYLMKPFEVDTLKQLINESASVYRRNKSEVY